MPEPVGGVNKQINSLSVRNKHDAATMPEHGAKRKRRPNTACSTCQKTKAKCEWLWIKDSTRMTCRRCAARRLVCSLDGVLNETDPQGGILDLNTATFITENNAEIAMIKNAPETPLPKKLVAYALERFGNYNSNLLGDISSVTSRELESCAALLYNCIWIGLESLPKSHRPDEAALEAVRSKATTALAETLFNEVQTFEQILTYVLLASCPYAPPKLTDPWLSSIHGINSCISTAWFRNNKLLNVSSLPLDEQTDAVKTCRASNRLVLTHIRSSVTSGRPCNIPDDYLNYGLRIFDSVLSTARDGRTVAEISLYSILFRQLNSQNFDQKNYPEFDEWRLEWQYHFSDTMGFLTEMPYYLSLLVLFRPFRGELWNEEADVAYIQRNANALTNLAFTEFPMRAKYQLAFTSHFFVTLYYAFCVNLHLLYNFAQYVDRDAADTDIARIVEYMDSVSDNPVHVSRILAVSAHRLSQKMTRADSAGEPTASIVADHLQTEFPGLTRL